MARIHVFADEAGNFDFRTAPNVSKFFIVCTVTMRSCTVANDLLALKRRLAWDQAPVGDYFHATKDTQAIRDEVFRVICQHDFQVQATVMEKAKADPKIRPTDARFYKHGWYQHFKWGMTKPIAACSEMHITAASVGTKRGQVDFTDAVRDVIKQTVGGAKARTSFWQSSTDPCLQLADYCAWAIQRKWEMGDDRSHKLIADRIDYEFDLFRRGTKRFY